MLRDTNHANGAIHNHQVHIVIIYPCIRHNSPFLIVLYFILLQHKAPFALGSLFAVCMITFRTHQMPEQKSNNFTIFLQIFLLLSAIFTTFVQNFDCHELKRLNFVRQPHVLKAVRRCHHRRSSNARIVTQGCRYSRSTDGRFL